MNKTTLTLLIAIACASFLLGQTIPTKAEGKNFSGVMPFITSAGYFGLFNQNDGKIYIYDSDIDQCTFQGRIDELGKAAIKINPQKTVLPKEELFATDNDSNKKANGIKRNLIIEEIKDTKEVKTSESKENNYVIK